MHKKSDAPRKSEALTDNGFYDGRIANKNRFSFLLTSHLLKVYFLVHHFTVQNPE